MQRRGCEEAQTQRGREGGGGGRWTEGAGTGLTQRSECRRPLGGRGAGVDGPRAAGERECRRPPGGRGGV